MAKLSEILRSSQDNGLTFKCPGCNDYHQINYGEGKGPRWTWNGDVNKPTFTPSILVRTGHYCDSRSDEGCWCTYYAEHPNEPIDFKCGICHSFVTDGNIIFLNDCTHSLAGKTVPLPPFKDIDYD